MPHLGPPSVSPKSSQRLTGNCTSLCRSDYEENWNLRLKGVCVRGSWGWGVGVEDANPTAVSVWPTPRGPCLPRSPQS